MITVVALLFFPAVLGMSVFRLCQLPRALWKRTRWVHPEYTVTASLALACTYSALATYTIWLLWTLVQTIAAPPQTLSEALSAASVLVGYPFVYLAYEWVYFYAILPRPRP